MPARKPQGLKTRHDTKAEINTRVNNEASMAPEIGLPMNPARLKGHEVAATTWRRVMRMYAGLEAVVVTALDQDILIDYCLLIEQLGELDLMRKTTYRMWLELGLAHDKAVKKTKEAEQAQKESQKALAEKGVSVPEQGPGSLAEIEKWEEQAVALASKSLDAWEAVLKLDSRTDRKRDLLLKLRQSLYLTPRARAAAAPDKKEAPTPKSELESLLDDVDGFLNGDGK